MEPGSTEQIVDIAQWVAVLGLVVTPPIIQLLKNFGRWWSDRTKLLVSGGLALVGAAVAYAASTDLSAVNVSDLDFWTTAAFAVMAMLGAQYASFKTIWKENAALGVAGQALAAVGQPADPGE
ncbi:hypothetical protein LCGC14_2440490 [marine sediment metagenome]|uniref:Uncharacterized protein n=1 Tax=marine sediment metagenome TaxID=412755 RepID=A0A0F9C6K4_9ZZZZ